MFDMPKRKVRREFEFISSGWSDLVPALGLALEYGWRTEYWMHIDENGFHISLHRLGDDWAARTDIPHRMAHEVCAWLGGQPLFGGGEQGWRMSIELTDDEKEIITIVPHRVVPIVQQQLVGAGHMSDQ